MMLCLKLTLLTLLIAALGLHVSGETVITCDGDVQRLTCDTGVILVTTTVYGRSDSKICSNAPRKLKVTDTSCYSTVSTIADRCNGLRECEVKTDLLGSSDPCKKTYKYYTTTYDCINARDVVVCEHGYRTLDCGADTIYIINANFGRADSVTCSSGLFNSLTRNTNCYTPNVLSKVTSLCNGQHNCTVESSTTIFTDSCKGTAKYLTVSYTCLKTLVTCQDSTANLSCGNLKIEISSASYGRTDFITCSTGRPASQLSNTNCSSSNALNIVNGRCDGESSCQVFATTGVFSDPCNGTYKYLTIVYSCI
ncbi:uncharacterized protein LOC113656110, partial [Tachysurus ichikawai]